MGLAGEVEARAVVDALSSTTARNEEIACNPHRPEGLRRNGIVFVVVGFSQCETFPRRRLLVVPARNNVTISERGCERTDRSGPYHRRARFSKVSGVYVGQPLSALRVRAERHRLWRRSSSQCASIGSSSLPQSRYRCAPKSSNAISDGDH